MNTSLIRKCINPWIRASFLLLVLSALGLEARAQAAWSQQTSGTTNFLNDVHFVSGSVGWVSGASATLLNTTNGGGIWSPVSTGISPADGFNSVRFIDQNVGWAGGLRSVIRTTDGGLTWGGIVFTGTQFRNSHFPVSSSVSWAVGGAAGQRTHFRYTFNANGSTTTNTFTAFVGDLMQDIYFVDQDNGWSVGSPGRIIRITSASTAPVFTIQTSGTTQQLNGIHMPDVNNGWVVGNNGTILKTTDGGATWTPQTSGVPAVGLQDVFFEANLLNGWAVGAGGTIIATTDGGNTWAAETSGVTSELRGIFFISGTGYAVGAGGTILIRRPTKATLESFTATAQEGGRVLLQWRTDYEVDNLGFRLYREQGGNLKRITPQMVAGSALLAGPGTVLTAGRTYAWLDDPPGGEGASYKLEEVDLDGTSAWHGPVKIRRPAAGNSGPPSELSEVMLLNKLGREGTSQHTAGPVELKAKPAHVLQTGQAARSGLSSMPAIKLAVKQEGWYRVTQQELVAAGLDPKANPRSLRLYVNGQEQPIIVAGEQDGVFDPSDALEFYGVGVDSAYSDTRAYWLVAAGEPGLRIQQRPSAAPPVAGGSFAFTTERKDRTLYFPALRNGEKENFFGAVIASEPVDQAIFTQNLDQSTSNDALLEVAIQGVTVTAHRVRVQLNGVSLGEATFGGQNQGLVKVFLPQGVLREGQNLVTLSAQGGESDVSLVDYIRLTYQRRYAAHMDALRFTAQGGTAVTVQGFTGEKIRVVDVTDPAAPLELVGTVSQQQGGFSVSVQPPAGQRVLLAFADDRAIRPDGVVADIPSSWRQQGPGADFVMISRRDFFESLAPLQELRTGQGLAVAVVDIEDIYDEFCFGEKTPYAVRAFLEFAKASWQKKPRFVLLAADASYDPKNYLGLGAHDLLPTKLIDTHFLETASDDWFADFDSDAEAEMAIGRLPVRTAQEAARLAAKIVGYEQTSSAAAVLLVADLNDGYDFEMASARLRDAIPAGFDVSEINRGQMDGATARAKLIEGINRGQRIVNYVGHGAVSVWRGNLLTSTDMGALNNASSLPLFIAMTCLNGYFHDPAQESLAEALLKGEGKGAIAVWASTGMTGPGDQAVVNRRMMELLFNSGQSGGGPVTLGEAARAAKAAALDTDVRRTWVLIGDPATRLR